MSSKRRAPKRYVEWPSSVDYAKRLKKTVTAKFPFIDEGAIKRAHDMLEWFHVYLSRFGDNQFRMMLRSRGVDWPRSQDFRGLARGERLRVERWLEDERRYWINEQVKLITSLTDEHRRRASIALLEHAGSPDKLADELARVLGVTHSRAQLIADDQTVKGSAALDRARQQAAGAITYRWITMRDERVRDSHADRHGRVYSYAGATHPGWEIRCRCHAEPIFPRNIADPETEL